MSRCLDVAMSRTVFVNAEQENGLLPAPFMLDPFIKLDSGGLTTVTLENQFKFPFGGEAELVFHIFYGDNGTSIASKVMLRGPTVSEAWGLIWDPEHRITLYLWIVAGVLLGAVAVLFLGLRGNQQKFA